MKTIIYFGILSLPVIFISWRSLINIKSHGFYRFFSWECIVWLFVANHQYWIVNPFGILQLVSWALLFLSAYMVISGYLIMRRKGKAGDKRADSTLYAFEKTTELIDTGIFKFIRHPLYGSLIFLTWAVFLKNPTIILTAVAFDYTYFFENDILDFEHDE